ncbi:TolC family protein [Luteibacter flocculans]|uniref:TolC family protein n=1 Tax=Luteibacter flocculans TaxID=2780091 RepID=A0ABY4SYQ6_9GAMM|nr:TolC family protein [Luteibacter flocculans]URL56892.1 TolC family protein [Luteibacter flocculans]
MKTTSTTPALRRAPLVASLAIAVFLTGCGAVKPKPLTHDEIATRVKNDQQAMYKGQEAVTAPLTLSDVMARSLKYNLDYRLKLMETALSRGLLDVSELDMLPKLMTDAGYRWRSNDSGGTSIGIQDRIVSLRPSTSEERVHYLADATLSWDVLDFGLSYYRAKQQADDVNTTDERRRKVLQNIVQDVRDAYWRALGAQRLLGETQALADNIQAALEKTRQAERAGVLPPVEGLEYQRALLDAMTLVNEKRQEMEFAKRELAALMSLPPGTDFTLADATETNLSQVPGNLDQLEQMALEQRPELREEDYKTRIDAIETKKQIAALFPNLNLFGGVGYDSNKYLYNENWAQGGVSMSMNLFRLAGIPAIKRTNKARMEVDDARRMALSMAILTQVRVSVERYKLAVYDHQLAQESAQVDQRLASVARAGSSNQLTSELETLRTQARSMVSRFQEASSYAAAQSAYGRVLNSVGIDLMPEQVAGTDVPALSRAIQTSLLDGEKQVFPQLADAVSVDRPIQLSVSGLPPRVDGDAVRSAVGKVMTSNRLALGSGEDSLSVDLRYSATPGKAAIRAQWDVTVQDRAGKRLLTQSYRSFMPNEITTRSVTALAEAAALSVMGDVRRLATAPETASAAAQ